MSKLRIKDAPLLPDINGEEKIPTGGRGDYSVSVDQIKTYARGGLPQQIEDHINDTENPHQVSKSQVGLGNADNTSDIDKPISDATQEALDLKANQSTTYTKTEVDGSLSLKADKSYVDSRDLLKADKTYVDNALSGFTNGASKFYPTLALAEADIANITIKDKVDIGEAANGGTWYKATAGATSLTKSDFDPLTQAKADASTKANEVVLNSIFANLARISSNSSLVDFAQVIASRQTDGWTRIRWAKGTDVLNTKGIFVAFKLDVVGAAYPTSYNDANVFSGGMRVQAFDSAGLKYTRNLVNLPNTKIWYYFGSDTDTALNVNDVTEIKVEFNAKTGVALTVSEPVLYPDNKLPNAEPLARDKAIQDNELKLFEDRLLSNMQTDEQNNLLTNVTVTNPSIAQLESPILSTTHPKYSVACIIDTDGTYPTDNSVSTGFRARFETVSGSTASNARFLKRIGNSKVWYAKDVKVSGTFDKVKIYAQKIDGTYVKIDKAIISPNSFPDNYYLNVNTKIPSEFSDLDNFVSGIVAQELSELNIESYPTTAFDALSRAETRRVDVVGFGDSNHYMDGYGFDYALRNALAARFGLYATPPRCSITGAATTGAPSAYEQNALASLSYQYIANGSTIAAGVNNGTIVANDRYLINASSNLRLHVAYGEFEGGAGSFKPGVRLEQSPYAVLQMSSLISTAGNNKFKIATVDLPAAPRSGSLGFKYAVAGQTGITGEAVFYFDRVEDLGKNNGICFSSLYGVGGQSMWDMNDQMQQYSMQSLTNYFSEIRRLQLSKDQKPLVVIYINSGLNDQNETSSPSWGWRESTDGKSATAYLDNLEALAKRVADVWQMNGWDERELFFLDQSITSNCDT